MLGKKATFPLNSLCSLLLLLLFLLLLSRPHLFNIESNLRSNSSSAYLQRCFLRRSHGRTRRRLRGAECARHLLLKSPIHLAHTRQLALQGQAVLFRGADVGREPRGGHWGRDSGGHRRRLVSGKESAGAARKLWLLTRGRLWRQCCSVSRFLVDARRLEGCLSEFVLVEIFAALPLLGQKHKHAHPRTFTHTRLCTDECNRVPPQLKSRVSSARRGQPEPSAPPKAVT